MSIGTPFNRKEFFKNIEYYTKNGYGTYRDLIELTIFDLREIKIGIDSKNQEEKLANALGG